MKNVRTATMAGLAMFAMFFGSGNLVFPLMIGAKTTDQYILSGIGFMITGVLVPFLGLFSMVLYNGDKNLYFGTLGKFAPFILSILILSLIGPFGVVPRCILVAFGSFDVIMPDLSLKIFSLAFVLIIFWIVYKKNEIVPLIGKILGPLKMGAILFIIVAAVYQAPELIGLPVDQNSFLIGFSQGYQTMDLMAAIFFSITIVQYLNNVSSSREEAINLSIKASIVGASLIAIVYYGFVYLGAHYSTALAIVRPEQYLATIAHLTLGKHAALIVAITVLLSCLVTAASLVRLFAEFLRKDIFKKRISWNIAVIITLCISYTLSLTGFATIFGLLASVLVYIYPSLITLAFTSILKKYTYFQYSKHCFWLTLIFVSLYNLF